MSHDLDMTTGAPAMAYVGEEPWHGLGEKLPENQSIEAWQKAARLEWTLQKLPAQYYFNGNYRIMPDRFILARSDSGDALSVVSGDYHVVQPREVLEFYRDLIQDSGYTLETAGALAGGRKVWALAKTGRVNDIGANTTSKSSDKLAAYVLLATSCDKTLATTAAFTSIRVVCQNTLSFAVQEINTGKAKSLKIPHSTRFDADDVKDKLGLLDKSWATFLSKIQEFAECKMDENEAYNFFKELLLPPPKQEKQKEVSNKERLLSIKGERELQSILSLYHSAPGQQLDTAKNTLWGAVNAVTYYVDHVKQGTNGERLDSAWFGSGALLKDKAWQQAMDFVNAT